ncbi:MAG: PEP/pyruvate-binding domain-containing protein [Syntrophorhabdales bacterium]|jgi:pyruvate,water dikinase
MEEKWIYWLEEVCADHNNLVGKKCANLGELTKAGFHVPPGYALSVDAYTRFMNESGAKVDVLKYLSTFSADPDNLRDTMKFEEASKAIRGIVESKKMPPDMERMVREYYATLCQRTNCEDTPVATRSAGPVSHPGQYETYLHVKGTDDVVQNVIRVWASTFNTRSIIARARLGLPVEYDPIGVAVLTMVDAKAAGVMFSLNPTDGDETKVVLEGNWGLGEAVVSGSINPDRFLVDKILLQIEERTISRKEKEFVYNEKTREMEYRELPAELKEVPCLEDKEVLELARVAKKIEAYFGCPQDSEWVISKSLPFPENVFLVQTRPESVWSKKKKGPVLGQKSGLEMLIERAVTPTKVKM